MVIINAALTRSWMSQNLLIKNHQHGLLFDMSNFEAKVMTDVVKAAVAGPNRPHWAVHDDYNSAGVSACLQQVVKPSENLETIR